MIIVQREKPANNKRISNGEYISGQGGTVTFNHFVEAEPKPTYTRYTIHPSILTPSDCNIPVPLTCAFQAPAYCYSPTPSPCPLLSCPPFLSNTQRHLEAPCPLLHATRRCVFFVATTAATRGRPTNNPVTTRPTHHHPKTNSYNQQLRHAHHPPPPPHLAQPARGRHQSPNASVTIPAISRRQNLILNLTTTPERTGEVAAC